MLTPERRGVRSGAGAGPGGSLDSASDMRERRTDSGDPFTGDGDIAYSEPRLRSGSNDPPARTLPQSSGHERLGTVTVFRRCFETGVENGNCPQFPHLGDP